VLYTSPECDKIGGTLALTLFIAAMNGQQIPCIKIDHMSAPTPHYGTVMLELCQKMLFLTTPFAPFGYVFGQCVDNSFWKKKLRVTAATQQLLFHANFLFDEEMFRDSTARGLRVENVNGRS
tara:strand:- start:209 stop:574 length:366 start_codon:yes stop_codon:yes gene_type:complete